MSLSTLYFLINYTNDNDLLAMKYLHFDVIDVVSLKKQCGDF
jgi:hypothetical protein